MAIQLAQTAGRQYRVARFDPQRPQRSVQRYYARDAIACARQRDGGVVQQKSHVRACVHDARQHRGERGAGAIATNM